MANRSMSAVVRKVEDAEKIIQSYAYGAELDRAIKYLQDHDPKNAVLATIKDFENDRPMLKALNALYRADKAREENDKAELEKIAKFLSLSENEELRSEAINIMRNLPENPVSDEKAKLINEALDEAKNNAQKVEETAQEADKKDMSDDEIVANANEISSLVSDAEFQKYVLNEAVKPAQEKVTVTDDEGNAVDAETSDNLWIAKMMSALQEVTMTRMDDAAFAAQKTEDKVKTLKDDVVSNFWTDLYGMTGASAMDPNKSKEENETAVDAIVKKFNNGGKVEIKSDHFVNSAVATKRKMDEKAANLAKDGKNKSGSWLKRASQKFGKFIKDYIGTPAEIKQTVIGYFSTARGVANTAAALTLTAPVALGFMGATAAVTVPVALGTMVGFSLYQSQAWRWNILEKRNANLKKAIESGNAKEIRVWEGKAGLRHAYNAIQANPREKERFDRQKRHNLWGGLGAAAIATLAAPVVLTGGLTALGLGTAATLAGTRIASSTTRVASANTNAYLQMKESIRQDKEDQTEESRKGANRAKGAFGLSLLFSGLAEYWMANAAFDTAAQDAAMHSLANNAENANAVNAAENGGLVGGADDANAPAADDADLTTTAASAVVVPDEWNASMGISEAQWNEMHDKFTGIFKNRAEIFNMDNKAPHLTWQNMYQNIENAKEAGALPNDMTNEQIMYKYMKLVENTERAEVVPGTRYLRSMLDADKQPMYYVDQTEMRALNDIILCGKEVSVSAEALGKSLARITENGVYVGEGAGIGVTHNRFVGFGRGEDCPDGTNNVNAWERVKAAVKNVIVKDKNISQEVIVTKTQEDAVIGGEPKIKNVENPDSKINQGANITSKPNPDVNADDGGIITTKHTYGSTDTGNDGELNTNNPTSYSRGTVKGTGTVPNSTVNAGAEKGTVGNDETAWMPMNRGGGRDMG